MQNRRFLFRLFLTTLLAACIPLLLISLLAVQQENRNLQEATRRALSSVTQSAAMQLNDYIDASLEATTRMQLSHKLHEGVISSSVQSEIDALEVIGNYRGMLGFALHYGLYIEDASPAVYSMDGKYRSEVYSRSIIGIEPDELRDLLASARERRFLAVNGPAGNLLYIVPIRTAGTAIAPRYGLFVLSPKSISAAMASLLADQYHVAAIRDDRGNLVDGSEPLPFDLPEGDVRWPAQIEADSGQTYLVHAQAARDFTIYLYMNESDSQQILQSLTTSMSLLSILSIVICVVLMTVVVFLNYRPIAKVYESIRRSDSGNSKPPQNELKFILESYTELTEEKDKLRYHIYEQNLMLVDNALERALSGFPAGKEADRYRGFCSPRFLVSCSYLGEAADIRAIIERNSLEADWYAIEMYAGCHLVFLCRLQDESDREKERALNSVRALLQQDILLGTSSVKESAEELTAAYREAAEALERLTASREGCGAAPESPSPGAHPGPPSAEAAYYVVMRFIADRFTDPLFSMNDIADHLGITIFAASRMLKNMIGINFRKYLNEMRVEHAKRLLTATDLPIGDVAEQSGFSSASYFISIFRQTENMTPNHYRKEASQGSS